MKVFLAGGSGFLGSNLATHFLDKNDEVVIINTCQKTKTKRNLFHSLV